MQFPHILLEGPKLKTLFQAIIEEYLQSFPILSLCIIIKFKKPNITIFRYLDHIEKISNQLRINFVKINSKKCLKIIFQTKYSISFTYLFILIIKFILIKRKNLVSSYEVEINVCFSLTFII